MGKNEKNEKNETAIVSEKIQQQNLDEIIKQLKAENDAKMKELEAKLAAKDKELETARASRSTGFKAGSCNAKAVAYVKAHELGSYAGPEQPKIKLQDLVRALIIEDAEQHKVDGKYEVQPATCCHQLRSHYKKMGWKVEQDAEVEG